MKFLRKVYDLGIINEQDEVPPPPSPEEPAAEPEAPAGEEVVTPLSPESEVLLVRLIKKAFVIKPDADDITAIEEFEDINEKNAKESLQKLIQLMNSYTTEIDIDV